MSLLFAAFVANAADYVKVTEEPTDWTGTYVLVYEKEAAVAHVCTELASLNSYEEVAITDATVTGENFLEVAIAKYEEGYSLQLLTGDSANLYIGRTENKNGVNFATTPFENTISLSGGKLTVESSAGAKLQYWGQKNGSGWDCRFQFYKSSQKALCLYKKAGSTPPSTDPTDPVDPAQPSLTVASTLDFGTVEVGQTFAAKELEIKAANIKEMIADFEPATEHFTLTGADALTAEGGTLTINCVATEVGTYTATLTVLAVPTAEGKEDLMYSVAITAKITPVSTGEKGTKESPYTVSEAIALNNPNEEAWVIGYILGSINGGAAGNPMDNSAKTNIALGDTPNATAYMPVKISADAQAALNVKDNKSNIGKRVKVYGLLKAYFNKPGIQTVSTSEHYEWVEEGTTAVENVSTTTSPVRKIYENGQIYIIRNDVKYTIFGVRVE